MVLLQSGSLKIPALFTRISRQPNFSTVTSNKPKKKTFVITSNGVSLR